MIDFSIIMGTKKTSSSLENENTKSSVFSLGNTTLLMLLSILGISILKTYIAGDPLLYMIPNLLMFTPFRQLNIEMWNKISIPIDTSIEHGMTRIPHIQSEDYNYESLKKASENFKYPVLIKGLLSNSPAVQKWSKPGYLSSKIGDWLIPVINNAKYGTMQDGRSMRTFRDSYEEILEDNNSKLYLFFPVKSRFSFNNSELARINELQKAIDKVVLEDLETDQIWKGFGSSEHKSFHGSQIIAGRGSNDTLETTGTGWHCAIGNNYFAQIVGRKRWFFMDSKYSSLMKPLRGGKVNMQTGRKLEGGMAQYHKHVPLRYADVEAGDLLYNPDWEWHTIKNYEGLSIGVPLRELNISLSIQNNAQYTSIVLTNLLLDKLGIDLGGYP